MPRNEARHKVDGTWVLKWKKVRKEVNGKLAWVRIVKARLTARGFKDMQAFAEHIKTYSEAATKWAQRAINGHAAQMGHTLFSIGISAAFLKGMAFKEIAQLTGDPPPAKGTNCFPRIRRVAPPTATRDARLRYQ